jgi:hypothetical protein
VDLYVPEFRARRLSYFIRVLVYGGLSVAAWQTFAQWFDVPFVGLSLAGLLAFQAVRALVGALFHVPFLIVRIGPDWVFGPGQQAGVQRFATREEVVAIRRVGKTLVLETSDKDLRLNDYGAEAIDLSQRLNTWFGYR